MCRRSVVARNVVLVLACLGGSRSQADTVSLQDLLSGQTITAGGLTFENFRNYGPTTYSAVTSTPQSASTVYVTATATGLTFTGINGTNLIGTAGQNDVGESFTFDVVSASPTGLIQMAALETSGELDQFLTNQYEPLPPFFTASLNVTGANPSPLSLVTTQLNPGSTNVTNTLSSYASFAGSSSLTVTEAFSASGLTVNGTNTNAHIYSVSVAFVPEPHPLGLFGLLIAIGGGARWLMARKSRQKSAIPV